ncbi:hypothetical protein PFAG_05481 [Plasmodium falciparum Santa Lucia]|uniref:[phosphatase 2A protein]-leucine-carboxy methyltransferase n=1 Tax=Plasmodium falciparum Santa Lucia TaxID=478859 RepID=W7FM17_PLAFA|nr:hypothetical protein PFAG_05481 [Plasmodium falciparum Santa Lucia]
MIDNFSHRGINLKSIYKYYNLQTQLERYKSLGWVNVYINDMNEIYDYHINMEEKKKIELIEMFDEFEEWRLLQNHYFILVAFNCYNNINLEELKQFLTCYYARVAALRLYIELFFKSIDNKQSIQIVNIGSGLDTTFFWINQKYQDVKYYEIDFYDLLKEKTDIIKKYTEMKNFLKYEKDNEEKDEDLINCLNYKMVPLDLNDSSSFEKILLSYNFDFNKPTIFICECVLIYLETESSDNLIKKLSELMKNTSCIIVYEQVTYDDKYLSFMYNFMFILYYIIYIYIYYPSN